MIHFSVLISWYIGPTLLHTCTDTHRRAQCPQVQTATMSIHKADRWSNRLSTAPCVCMCTVVGVYFLFIRLYFVSLPAVAQRCPALTGMGEIRAQISLWKREGGREQEARKKRRKRRVLHSIHLMFFLPPPSFRSLSLTVENVWEEGWWKRWREEGKGLQGGKLKN